MTEPVEEEREPFFHCSRDKTWAVPECWEEGHPMAIVYPAPGHEPESGGRPPDRTPGPIESALEQDLARADLSAAGKPTLAAMARKLARVIDRRGEDEPASQTAKAVETLRITMDKILARETDDPDTKRRLEEILQTPSDGGSSVPPALRYPPEH